MGLSKLIEDLINEHGSAAIMKERLALLRDQAMANEKEKIKLEQEITALKNKLGELERELAARANVAEFEKCRGGLFKRKPGGGYDLTVYCPRCYNPMFSMEGHMPYSCVKCRIYLDFTKHDLHGVMAELPSL